MLLRPARCHLAECLDRLFGVQLRNRFAGLHLADNWISVQLAGLVFWLASHIVHVQLLTSVQGLKLLSLPRWLTAPPLPLERVSPARTAAARLLSRSCWNSSSRAFFKLRSVLCIRSALAAEGGCSNIAFALRFASSTLGPLLPLLVPPSSLPLPPLLPPPLLALVLALKLLLLLLPLLSVLLMVNGLLLQQACVDHAWLSHNGTIIRSSMHAMTNNTVGETRHAGDTACRSSSTQREVVSGECRANTPE